MPELPEVEGFRALVDKHVVGRTVVRARFLDDWMLKGSSPSSAARRMRGRGISTTDRRGKLLLLFTEPQPGKPDSPVLALHFGMTGHPLIEPADAPIHHWDRVLLDLDSGMQFRYRNSRRLGSIRVVTRNEAAELAWQLGPDALEVPAAFFREQIQGREAAVKAVLLDQTFVAGVGNMYADEALFAAGIRPSRPATTLRPEEADRLYKALGKILRRATKAHQNGRDAVFPLMAVRRRASRQLGRSGSPKVGCPGCTRPLRSARIGGRTSFYCPSCQR